MFYCRIGYRGSFGAEDLETDIWLERWRTGNTGWHQPDVNPLLVEYWPKLKLPEDCPVFVPLCGKSLDMVWLRTSGHPVYGVEIAEAAVCAFFEENGIRFEVAENRDGLPRFSGGGYRIYCGDYLEISAPQIGVAQGTYDRGALIALPPDRRPIYADHIQRVIPEGGETLLITLDYDQSRVSGPPFSVSEQEVQELYGERGRVRRLACFETELIPPHFMDAGLRSVTESVYRITKEC